MEQILIKNARLLTMEGETIENGWLLSENGKIAGLGDMSGCPDSRGTVIDGAGGWLLPGLLDIHSHIGLYEDSLGFEGADGNEDTDPATPQLRALDGINPMDEAFREAVEAGVTTVLVSPGSANPIGGQIAAMKTAGRRVDDMLLMAPAAMKFALGENPKGVYHDKDETPVTRMATAAIIREQLYLAQEYRTRKEKSEIDNDAEEPDFDMKLEALLPVLRGEIPAHFHAHRCDDIFTALRICREFGIRPVILHGTEGHLVADILAEEGVPVVSGPFLTDRSKPELRNLTESAPGMLSRSGVLTAITVDHPEFPLRLLMDAVRAAVRGGMEERQALRAVTIDAARIAGLEARVGSLTAGKDADCVLYSGNPFDYKSVVNAVICDGKLVYRR